MPKTLSATARARKIKLLLFDVDGVLTDGKLFIFPAAEDSGAAVGTAFYGLWQMTGMGKNTCRRLSRDTMGKTYTDDEIDRAIDTTPGLSFITPNMADDGHDAFVDQTSAWAAYWVRQILASAAYRQDGMVIIVYDESSASGTAGAAGPLQTVPNSCCGEIPGPNSPSPGAFEQAVTQEGLAHPRLSRQQGEPLLVRQALPEPLESLLVAGAGIVA